MRTESQSSELMRLLQEEIWDPNHLHPINCSHLILSGWVTSLWIHIAKPSSGASHPPPPLSLELNAESSSNSPHVYTSYWL